MVRIKVASTGFNCPFQVQGQQTGENLVVSQIIRPTVGSGNGFVQSLVGVIQPGRAGVVEVGQGPFFQVGFMPRLGNRAFGITSLFFLRGY